MLTMAVRSLPVKRSGLVLGHSRFAQLWRRSSGGPHAGGAVAPLRVASSSSPARSPISPCSHARREASGYLAVPGWRGASRSYHASTVMCQGKSANQDANTASDRIPAPPKISANRVSGASSNAEDLVLGGLWGGDTAVERRVFCNRSLSMESIKAVGFDMDYTLAQYRPEAFEALAYRLTVEKLVEIFNYPEVLNSFKFDWQYMVRGLTIDKVRGNMLKIDRHKYVKVAYHGFKELTREERLDTYTRLSVRDALDDRDKYTMIDTLFSLAEAYLFMQIVELKDERPELLTGDKSYFDIYRDVRGAVDLCHRDGSLKKAVAASPEEYIHEDPSLVPLLKQLRKSGRKVFLATNSLWDYTHVVMNYLLCGAVGTDKSEKWLEYFDCVVTGCGKPGFFTEHRPLFEVQVPSGLLYNTDDGTPMVPIGLEDLPDSWRAARAKASRSLGAKAGRVFQGGTYRDLHKMISVSHSGEVLYVGDHIYGDIVRSKKSLGWRTLLVLPELEAELLILQSRKAQMRELAALRRQRGTLEDQISRMEWQLENCSVSGETDYEELQAFHADLKNLKEQRDRVHLLHSKGLRDHHHLHHGIWGQILKTSNQSSQFAHQIDRYACLYTSHVANLLFYSPDKKYRGKLDRLQHEEEMLVDDLSDLSAELPDGTLLPDEYFVSPRQDE